MAVFGYASLEAVGIVVLSYFGLKVFWGVWQTVRLYLLSGPLGLSLNFRNYAGKWAVVTGSTNGIGKAYAEELAARGLNIVLISRSEGKLKTVAAEIEGKAGVQTKILVADFGSTDIYDNIKKELEGLGIACLVNNVGTTAARYPEFFLNVDDERELQTMTNINVMSVIKMTWIVLPGMVERKNGVIINISSVFGVCPVPLMTTYAGSKGFALQFSRSLAVEYKSKGIIVQTVTPAAVSTNMIPVGPNFLVPSPNDFVRSALNTVGLVSETCGCFSHSLQLWIVSLFPQEMVSNWVFLPGMKMMRPPQKKTK